MIPAHSSGFFIFETMFIIHHVRDRSLEDLFHAIFSFYAMFVSLYYESVHFAALSLMHEFSTAMVYSIWLCRRLGMSAAVARRLWPFYIMSFFACRIAYAFYEWKNIIDCISRQHWDSLPLGFVVWGLGAEVLQLVMNVHWAHILITNYIQGTNQKYITKND